jgi:hypothetical protein
MENPVLALKNFSAHIIEKEKLTPPVQIELMDLGMNPLYEMEARKDGEGTCMFSKERPIQGTVWRPSPYRVRFTAAGKEPILLDFPFPQN